MEKLKAPFPYFGGKSLIAPLIWGALGQPKHYIEPFFGSGAVLLARPHFNYSYIETVNDKDCFLSNVWRSIKFSPDKTAHYCDWPVNHADLQARRMKLIQKENYLLQNLTKDDEWHDPQLAGYWIWGTSCWIAAGLTTQSEGNKRPQLSRHGKGVNCKIPNMSGSTGVNCSIPNISGSGEGVVKSDMHHSKFIYEWFKTLCHRFRKVRVVCGDWERVCGGNWQDGMGDVGIFFDPPYGGERAKNLYKEDDLTISQKVKKWCIARGNKKTYRIVLAGYEGEHNELEEHGWFKLEWKAQGGFGNTGKKEGTKGKENRHLERLWLSPYCRTEKVKQTTLI